MNRLALAAASAALLALTTTACGSSADAGSAASKSSGSTATVNTPTPTPSAAPSAAPFNVGGYLAGTAKPTLPAGEPGQVAVVAQGTLKKPGSGAILPIAFRNNTTAAVSHVDLSATARLNGKLVASGRARAPPPHRFSPGRLASDSSTSRTRSRCPPKG